ncbi:MAG: ATP-binding protein [Candidatus Omnitrophica bacterium]|nr:ATP-binding protein [Candidatus Omnitrophota bacterium]MDD5653763.1 ATP-binding protein [Candidatus Omnitrophota bacterium]
MPNLNIETIGNKTGEITVSLSYRIIELFSAGLYSSPNKAFEELVSNSYDAFATKVAVYVPRDKSLKNAILWVCDNGTSMDSAGLRWLWKIGETNKRLPEYESKDRLPIGQFGIGKLATYVLAYKLTYICKADGKYRAVTMDFGKLDTKSTDGMKSTDIILDERELSEKETRDVLTPYIEEHGKNLIGFDLWGANAEKTWTFAIMSDLKAKATEIQEGRLQWILRTALPLSPNFSLFYNGDKLESSKIDVKPAKTWIIGKNDSMVKKFNEYTAGTFKGAPCVNLPNIQHIHGYVELYRDSLLRGKAEEWGRSHGIFLMVRDRLINLDDPLIGMPAMTHGVFNRVRIIVHADELDAYVTSPRESIKESESLNDLKKYIQRKFEEVREYYFNILKQEEKQSDAAYKVSRTPSSLARRPLLIMAKKFFSGEIDNLLLTDIPKNLTKKQQDEIEARLEKDLTSKEGIIKEISWEVISPSAPVAKLDLSTGRVRINLIHPFFANFTEEVNSLLPFQLMAIAEILTEASLIESGIKQEQVRDIMERRDQLLRELTFNEKPNAPLVSQMIQASLSNSSELEDSVFSAFSSLGFETTAIGGKGKPDGVARAILGVRVSGGKREDYSLVYDAKSTKKERIQAGTARISGAVRHRDDYKADYAVVVSIDFAGGEDQNSAVSKEAKKHKVTLIRASDLATLVLIAAPQQLCFLDFKDLLDKCHTVKETSKWIEDAKKRKIKRGPIKELLETTYQLMKTDKEPPELSALRMKNKTLGRYSKDELRSLVESLKRLVPAMISLDLDVVSLQAPPDKILSCIDKALPTGLPKDITDAYLQAFETKKKSKAP